jgi:methionyl aminopeptidase
MRPKTDQEIELMRSGGQQLAKILNDLSKLVIPGVTGREIADAALKQVKSAGLQPTLVGYEGYPDAICISVNDAVVHGIPTKAKFKEGDVVKLDLTVANRGMIIDSALTVIAGDDKPTGDVKRLIEGSQRALSAGIDAIKGDGTRVGDIASAVQNVLDSYKLGIVRDLVGHGVGYDVHEEPNIPNYGVRGTGLALMAGMTIAIEPMATLGDWHVDFLKDGWTVATHDGSLSAHFEHTVLITDKSAEILTAL